MKEKTMHTPGPWKVEFEEYGDEWWFGGSGEGQFIIKADSLPDGDIAVGGLYRSGAPEQASTLEANARLIAQSPAMCDTLDAIALKSCCLVEALGRKDSYTATALGREINDMARAAIQAARETA
jgi:hypothetical protein